MSSEVQAPHSALRPGNVAVVTGAASGIGRAAARRFAELGLRIVLIDHADAVLDSAAAEMTSVARGGADDVLPVQADVADYAAMARLRDVVADRFGDVSVLMNNAGINDNPGNTWSGLDGWRRVIDVNFWGVAHGIHAFVPSMVASGQPGLVINTGSKQGITTPPGNPAHNASKACVKVLTEALAHELRTIEGCGVTAHLLIPGFTFTAMTGRAEKPPMAWTADAVIDFMLAGLANAEFYILCPDHETPRALDEKRIRWAAEDMICSRPALSRWHPEHAEAYRRFISDI
ncbi:SDR family NAD(P)-dependent oxidoreductase [Starkeya sp. ORNL1]|uniref:SDR family NAD(P)-dependent oxidoreductase n=1 Tax=Starkeya sp. ORNL1 TaxID=2709380 RepID=UPI0014643EEA|nr:SDR family NAD(P)-dependent oxidoreductase [Starkeya sp. ORNL1]QJP16813.1 SDR family NAD(P)-dependent oxidoreductase [Starkeya sp. ORNL1]